MVITDPHNSIFQKAIAFVNQTNSHLFLTGKAGTGKTTFLKYIRENSFKKMAIVAPTGVAAINAGGVTIHSLFQLPFGPFIPTVKSNWEVFDGRVNNPHSLFKNLRFTSTKRDLLKELDLLVIDEVSMVRADMLDAVDNILRHVRRQPLLPFGGIQLLYIGDLFQLPPVVKNEEWQILKEYYSSPFFFDAQVITQMPPVYIELNKIYRQSDAGFINILNNIRNNECSKEDLDVLHQFYKPEFRPTENDHFITLTSHNEKADLINRRELQKLNGKAHSFKAEISGEFYDRSFPADEILNLKEGAQIMFIKNDKGEFRRFYNGKIGMVKKLSGNSIQIAFPNEPDELELEHETWQNIKYEYNKEKDKIDEEELGTFKQYPIRLAWAITIHKSQGLTFERAIIDAGASFAPGQVYVALSRLTTLNGLVLHSRIQSNCISTDSRVIRYVNNEQPEDELEKILREEQQLFVKHSLLKGFSWQKPDDAIQAYREGVLIKEFPLKDKAIAMGYALSVVVSTLKNTSQKFVRQLEQLYIETEGGYQQLYARTKAAVEYFSKLADEQLILPIDAFFGEMKDHKKVKRYLNDLVELKRVIIRQQQVLQQTMELAKALMNASEDLLLKAQRIHRPHIIEIKEEEEVKKTVKLPKGETARLSLQLYKEGKTILEIAKERNLSYVTIEGHLAGFILTGEVEVHELISPSKLEKVLLLLKEEKMLPPSSVLKSKLSPDFSYGEIKAAMKYWEKEHVF